MLRKRGGGTWGEGCWGGTLFLGIYHHQAGKSMALQQSQLPHSVTEEAVSRGKTGSGHQQEVEVNVTL